MSSRKNAFASIEIIAVVVVVAVIALLIFYLQSNKGENAMTEPTPDPYTTETLPSPSPVSDSTDVNTLEQELDATVVGDFEADINSMKDEASGL